MVTATRHTGIVVTDMEVALRFYRDLLGLSVWREALEQGDYIDQVTGLNGVRLRWVKLKAPDGSLVELLQYLSHPDAARPNQRSHDIGCSHVAFTVQNLHQAHARLSAEGVRFNCEPQVSPDGKARVTYCHDPDGTIVELVEELG